MKLLTNLAILSFLLISISSCKKADKAEEANVTIEFEHFVDEKKLEKDSPLDYLNAAGNNYSVSTLKYYITNIVLVSDAGKEVALNRVNLIDAFGNATIEPITLPNGHYTHMRFIFGVDPVRNSTGEQSGDLDPSLGMFWSWSTGYRFMIHEGKYLDKNNTAQNYVLHLGTQAAASDIDLPIGLTIDGEDKNAYVSFNINNFYNSPVIDFNDDNDRHSNASEGSWVTAMTANVSDVFVYNGSKSE